MDEHSHQRCELIFFKEKIMLTKLLISVLLLTVITVCNATSPVIGFTALPAPKLDGDTSVEKALQSRRSTRQYTDGKITIQQLSQILWSAYGITQPMSNFRGGLRTAPSAGAMFPFEIYVVIGKVDRLKPGIYKYYSEEHKILEILDKDIREDLAAVASNQNMFKNAPITIVYTAIFSKMTERYGSRGAERYVWIDLGHSAQNVYLQATAMGLGTCAVGAFDDAKLKDLLLLPESEQPLYLMPVGVPNTTR